VKNVNIIAAIYTINSKSARMSLKVCTISWFSTTAFASSTFRVIAKMVGMASPIIARNSIED
jgi:hypothetical protein